MELENKFRLNEKMEILDGMYFYRDISRQIDYVCRYVITLKEPVDVACLQNALENAVRKHSIFQLKVIRDDENFYLVRNTCVPIVHKITDRHVLGSEENNGYLVWIGVDSRKIIVDWFHGISDARGALRFVKSLISCYCAKVYEECSVVVYDEKDEFLNGREIDEEMLFLENIKIETSEFINEQLYESVLSLQNEIIKNNKKSYSYTLTVDATKFEEYVFVNKSSRTAVFATFMNWAIEMCYLLEDQSIVGAIAVDTRKVLKAEESSRNCTCTIPVWYNCEIKNFSKKEQLRLVKRMIMDAIVPENILHIVCERKKFFDYLRMNKMDIVKKGKIAQKLYDKIYNNYTYLLSYVGECVFESNMKKHVSNVELFFGSKFFPIIIEIVKYKDFYTINYCTSYENDTCVWKLRDVFLREGIFCECKQNEDYEEAWVSF